MHFFEDFFICLLNGIPISLDLHEDYSPWGPNTMGQIIEYETTHNITQTHTLNQPTTITKKN